MRSPAGLVALALVLALGWLRWGKPDAAAPAPSELAPAAAPTSDSEPDEARSALAAAVAAAEANAPIRTLLAMQNPRTEEDARADWDAARRALRPLLEGAGFPALGERLMQGPPVRALANPLGRLALLERLLTVTARVALPLLPDPPAGPAAVLARWVGVVREDRISGVVPGSWDRRAGTYRAALAVGGRTWVALRSNADLIMPARPELGPNFKVRLANPAGVAFRGETEHLPALVTEEFYDQDDLVMVPVAPLEIDAALPGPPPRELWLATVVFAWPAAYPAVLEVVGRDETLEVPVAIPQIGDLPRPPRTTMRQAFYIHVPAALVPTGARRIRLRPVGLQPLGPPRPAVNVEELWLLTAGPPPAGLDVPRARADGPGE